MSIDPVFEAQVAVQSELMTKPNVVGVAVGLKIAGDQITDEVAIVVLVERKRPKSVLTALEMIPRLIDRFKTDVYEVGTLQAGLSNPAMPPRPTGRFRPNIPIGVSLGHYQVTAGTYGALVRDRSTGELFVLSNNHVLANANDGRIGDVILQPSAIDGGANPQDVVARLARYVPLHYLEEAGRVLPPIIGETNPQPTPVVPLPPVVTPPSGLGTGGPAPVVTPPKPNGCDPLGAVGFVLNKFSAASGSNRRVAITDAQTLAQAAAQSVAQTASAQSVAVAPTGSMQGVAQNAAQDNYIDAALARPTDVQLFSTQVRNIGPLQGVKPVSLGMRVRKNGRTTDYTEAMVTLLNATVNITYNTMAGRRTARFTGQVITQAMSQGGDSGSLVIDALEPRAVGLLFGGSPTATIFTPLQVVLDALNVDLVV
jgi:hypothetical protein